MKPQIEPAAVRHEVKEAFRRAEIDSARISVDVEGAKVVLSGSVRSELEREEAELRTRGAHGVETVDNRLAIERSEQNGAGDAVYEASLESFPASDAPAWTSGVSDARGAKEPRKPSKSR